MRGENSEKVGEIVGVRGEVTRVDVCAHPEEEEEEEEAAEERGLKACLLDWRGWWHWHWSGL
jgi:hypothetical protein